MPVQARAPAPVAELHVSSDPSGAACVYDGTARGVTPLTLSDVPPGQALLKLTKPGYHELRTTVIMAPGARTSLDLRLEPERGLVLVQSDPAGAEVALDGAAHGKTPLLIPDLAYGTHRLRLDAPGYIAKETELKVQQREPIKSMTTLVPSTATFEVTSDPPGASVALDGASGGLTPVTLERVASGEHRLRVQLDGHAPFEQSFSAEPGQRATIDARLEPLPARLSVVSVPPGARLYVDNQRRGDTPVTLEGLKPGAYRLRAELPGFATVGRTVTLELAGDAVEEIRLESNSGPIELVTEPTGVNAFIDGQAKGTTVSGTNETDRVSMPLVIRYVETGPHTLQLTKPGYFDQEQKIEIRKDETLPLHLVLKRRFIPDYEVITDAGVDRGLLVDIDAKGTVRLEVRPGVVKSIAAKDIKVGRPLKQQALPKLEAPPPTEASPPP